MIWYGPAVEQSSLGGWWDQIKDRPGHNWSRDACRFRRNQHCWYPKDLNEEATKEAGYAVWIPHDRGTCLWDQWDKQRTCLTFQPGEYSGDSAYYTNATIPWEEGGQRTGTPVHDPTRRSTPGQATTQDESEDLASTLTQLAVLYQAGALTPEEYQQAKTKVLKH